MTTRIALYFALFLSSAFLPTETYHLARAIEGERPDLVCTDMGLPACQAIADRIGRVALNRLDALWCESVRECVDGGFWGAADVVTPQRWAVESALRVLSSGEKTSDFYVFSAHDTEKLELCRKEANWMVENGDYGLYFYGRDTQW